MQEVTVNLAAAQEISKDAAVGAVSSEADGIYRRLVFWWKTGFGKSLVKRGGGFPCGGDACLVLHLTQTGSLKLTEHPGLSKRASPLRMLSMGPLADGCTKQIRRILETFHQSCQVILRVGDV